MPPLFDSLTLPRVRTFLLLALIGAFSVLSDAQVLLAVRYGNDGWKMADVTAQEAWQGKRNAAILLFTNFCNDSTYINNLFATQLPNIWNSGHVPIISWQPKACPGAATPSDIDVLIESGTFDSYLQTWAKRLKQFLAGPDGIYGTPDDRRAYLRLAHEMNGDWYPWSATTGGTYGNPGSGNKVSDYIGMWQHVHNRLAALGLDSLHVQWIWCPNATDSIDSHPLEDYYPGDAYVDWVGVDGYNFGGSRWITAADRFTTPFARLHNLAPAKPLAVPETGTVAVTSTGTVSLAAKNSWLAAAYAFFSSNNVKLVSYFDKDMPSSSAYGIFGWSSGDQSFLYNGVKYLAFSGYKLSVAGAAFTSANLSNPRLLTDAQFTGAAGASTAASATQVTAQLSVSPASGPRPLKVTASTAGSSGDSSLIDFGDGTVANGPTATHTYSHSGSYTVTATVQGAGGSAKATALVNVTAKESFKLTWNGAAGTQANGASFVLAVAPVGGSFYDPVHLSCAGLPSFAKCLFSPSVVVPGTRATSARVTLVLHTLPVQRLVALMVPFWGIGFAGIVFQTRSRRRVRHIRLLAIGIVLLLLALLLACGATNTNTSLSPTAADATRSFSFAVVGTSGMTQDSLHLTAIVDQQASGASPNPRLVTTPAR